MIYIFVVIVSFSLKFCAYGSAFERTRYEDLTLASDMRKYYQVPMKEWSFNKFGYLGWFMAGTQKLYIPLYKHFHYKLYDVKNNKVFTILGKNLMTLLHEENFIENISLFKITKYGKTLFYIPKQDRQREVFEREYFYMNSPEIAWSFLPQLDPRHVFIASQPPQSLQSPRTLFMLRTQSNPF